jgi:exonuclease SbcD
MSLTLIHTSDWHLGHELADHPREAEHRLFLAWLLDQLDEQAADVLLVTGDVYDVANPPVSAMRQLYRFLRDACERRPGLQVVILGGNHDSAGKIELPGHLLGGGQVRFVGALPRRDGQADCEPLLVPLASADGQTAAWLATVPFCRPGDLGAETLQQLYARVAEVAFTRAKGLPVILSGHLHVAGGAVSELSERRIVVGGQEAEAATLFDPRAAYVALGHLHRPQQITAETLVRYAGSPFPLSATERDYKHSITVLDVSPGKCEVREVPIPRPAPFIVVPTKGARHLDEVVAMIEALELDESLPPELTPFLEVSVLVSGPEPHLQARIHAALQDKPLRLTRIVRQIAGSDVDKAALLAAADLADLKPEAVFAALHAQRFGGEPPADDLASAFAALLVEAEHVETIAEAEA